MRTGFAQLAHAERRRQGRESRSGRLDAVFSTVGFIAGFLFIGCGSALNTLFVKFCKS